MKMLLILLLVGGVLFFLYERGWVTVQSKRAIYFVGRIDSARYSQCSGTQRRIFRPKESREYQFRLQQKMTKGFVQMKLLDSREVPLLLLDRSHPEGRISLEKGKKYHLMLFYYDAEGSHQLHIQ